MQHEYICTRVGELLTQKPELLRLSPCSPPHAHEKPGAEQEAARERWGLRLPLAPEERAKALLLPCSGAGSKENPQLAHNWCSLGKGGRILGQGG